MKLYYFPQACSLSPHIALYEAGLAFEAVRVDIQTHRLPDGTDFRTINPKGYVPVLQFEDGTCLAEGPAIVQWIADQVPERQLAPRAGSMDRYRLQEWMTFVGTEIHKQFSPLFNPAMPDEAKAQFRNKVLVRLAYVDEHLADSDYLVGNFFSVADGYLFTVVRWAEPLQLDLSKLMNLKAFMGRIAARPAVQLAMQAEGIPSPAP